MAMNQGLIMEFKTEAANTRKMIERIPADKYTWKPHAKSTELLRLAAHIANTPLWVGRALTATEYDFSKAPRFTNPAENVEQVLAYHDKHIADAIKVLENAKEEDFHRPWSLRAGEKVFFTMPAIGVLRGFAFSHIIHHRGQLSVYLRMLDVPVPGMYGPSADETM